jgi:immune inhibitor A
MWWSGNDQDWADNRLTRTIAVPATDPKFWMWNNYVIEADWDFGFVEVSTDGGATWAEQKVFDATGKEVSTPDGYGDPFDRMKDYGNKKYGLTGDSHGWRPRLRQPDGVRRQVGSDPAALRDGRGVRRARLVRGRLLGHQRYDDRLVRRRRERRQRLDQDDRHLRRRARRSAPAGGSTPAPSSSTHYYLAEWRNFDGFDEGLKYAYDTTYSSFGPWKVEKIKYNAPGMLVWYRDTTYGNQNPVLATTYDLPSTGSKGGLLIVDSHFDPLRRQGVAAVKDPSTLNNMPSRPQSSNAAFGRASYPFKECLAEVKDEDWRNEYCTSVGSLPAVNTFTDAKGWYPGIETRPGLFFRDIDASVVIPNRGNKPYSVRFVHADGTLATDHPYWGQDIGLGVPLGTGDPTDPYGVKLTVQKSKQGNTIGQIRVQPAK